jgi:hypothetical protein
MSATHPTDAERDRAAWTLLQAQIDLARRQARWEPWKALAAILAAAAVIAGAIVALANWSGDPKPIVVRIEQPLAIKVTP